MNCMQLQHRPAPGLRLSSSLGSRQVHCVKSQAQSSSRSQLLGLTQWAISNGIKYAKVRPEDLERGRGMVATFDIRAGEALVSVPPAAALRTFPGDTPPPSLAAALGRSWAGLPWYVRLALRICAEQQQGSSSKFAAALAALPSAVDLPAVWTQEELEQLQCRHMIQRVQEQQQDWQQWSSQLGPSLQRAGVPAPALLQALCVVRSRTFAAPYLQLPLSSLIPAAAALQAAAAVAAVAVGGAAAAGVELLGLLGLAAAAGSSTKQAEQQEQHALCPLMDMFNHDSRVESVCQLDVWSGDFRLASSRDWAAGQQVFISYGSSSNDALLQLYGFVERDNPADRYILCDVAARLGELEGATASSSSSSGELEQVELLRTGLPASTAASLAQQLGAAPLPAGGAGDGSGGAGSSIVTYASLPSAVKSVLAALVQQELQQLGSSQAEDEQLLEDIRRLPEAAAYEQAVQGELGTAEQQLGQLQQELAELQQQQGEEVGPDPSSTSGASTAEAAAAVGSSSGNAAVSASVAVLEADVSSEVAGSSAGSDTAELLSPAELALQAVAAAQQQREGLRARQGELAAEVALLLDTTGGVKEVAVQYRLVKKQLLAEVLAALQ